MIRRALVLVLALGVGACAIPLPFEHDASQPGLARPEHVSTKEVADLDRLGDAALQEPVSPRPNIRIAPLPDLPGDGGMSLRRALKSALERRGVLVVSEGGALAVSAAADIVPVEGSPDQRTLRLIWSVTRDGVPLGQAAQNGTVAQATLSGPWGRLAHDIAEGSADGIVQVLKQH